MKSIIIAGLLATGLASAAHASVVVGAVSVDASSERGNVPAINTINQSGLSQGYISGVTDFDTYIGSDPTHTLIAVGNEWFSDFDNITATLTFDLGSIFSIDRVALWVEESGGFGTADLSASTDGVNFTSLSTINPFDNPLADYSAEVFGFQTTALRYFRMDMRDCPQDDPGSTNECSLGEIAFSAVAAVPVPAGGLLILSALGGLVGMRRRKKA